MKKKLLAFTLLLCMVFATFAQDKKAEQPKTGPANKSASAGKPAAAPTAVRKDGKPDMRYKANKEAAKPTGPLRKDGKPDMRYKANKEAAKQEGPKKKDGTPDKRFKENKEGERKKG